MKKLPILKPDPNADRFCKVIRGEVVPERPPFVELFLDQDVHKRVITEYLGLDWVPYQSEDKALRAKYWDNYIESYYRLGYDFVWLDGHIKFPLKMRVGEDGRMWSEESEGPIQSWQDFDNYKWPEPNEFDFWDFEYVSKHLKDGMGICAFSSRGFLEVPTEILFGYESFCMLMYDEPELIDTACQRTADTLLNFYRQVRDIDKLIGFFPGDDMGFNTQTMISPKDMRRLILPHHKKAAELAHEKGLLYLLHSCGNLASIMDDLIDDVKIDAKHSFEDSIMPAPEFKRKYGDRIGVLGGIDVHKLCTLPEAELRKYVRETLDKCAPGGRYALGTGNSVANYIPLENYLLMLEEGYNWNR